MKASLVNVDLGLKKLRSEGKVINYIGLPAGNRP